MHSETHICRYVTYDHCNHVLNSVAAFVYDIENEELYEYEFKKDTDRSGE